MTPDEAKRLYNQKFQAETKSLFKNRADDVEKGMGSAVVAMRKIAEELANVDLKGNYCEKCNRSGMGAGDLAKSLSYVTKVVDEAVRMLEFAQGRADQRSEVVGLGDLLRALTDEQAAQVQTWLEAAHANHPQ